MTTLTPELLVTLMDLGEDDPFALQKYRANARYRAAVDEHVRLLRTSEIMSARDPVGYAIWCEELETEIRTQIAEFIREDTMRH